MGTVTGVTNTVGSKEATAAEVDMVKVGTSKRVMEAEVVTNTAAKEDVKSNTAVVNKAAMEVDVMSTAEDNKAATEVAVKNTMAAVATAADVMTTEEAKKAATEAGVRNNMAAVATVPKAASTTTNLADRVVMVKMTTCKVPCTTRRNMPATPATPPCSAAPSATCKATRPISPPATWMRAMLLMRIRLCMATVHKGA